MTDNLEYHFNKLISDVHQDNLEAGWWQDDNTDSRTNKYCFSNKLSLIHSELSEALEGDRKGTMDSHLPHRKTVEVELADALIRLLDLAGAYELDIYAAMQEKRAYNKQRIDHKKSARNSKFGKKY